MTYRPQPLITGFIVKSINAKSTGATIIGTTLPGMSFAVLRVYLIAATLTGAAAGPTFQVGTNSTSFNNIVSSTVFSPASAAIYGVFNPNSTAIAVPASTAVEINITRASTSTTMTIHVLVVGTYY